MCSGWLLATTSVGLSAGTQAAAFVYQAQHTRLHHRRAIVHANGAEASITATHEESSTASVPAAIEEGYSIHDRSPLVVVKQLNDPSLKLSRHERRSLRRRALLQGLYSSLQPLLPHSIGDWLAAYNTRHAAHESLARLPAPDHHDPSASTPLLQVGVARDFADGDDCLRWATEACTTEGWGSDGRMSIDSLPELYSAWVASGGLAERVCGYVEGAYGVPRGSVSVVEGTTGVVWGGTGEQEREEMGRVLEGVIGFSVVLGGASAGVVFEDGEAQERVVGGEVAQGSLVCYCNKRRHVVWGNDGVWLQGQLQINATPHDAQRIQYWRWGRPPWLLPEGYVSDVEVASRVWRPRVLMLVEPVTRQTQTHTHTDTHSHLTPPTTTDVREEGRGGEGREGWGERYVLKKGGLREWVLRRVRAEYKAEWRVYVRRRGWAKGMPGWIGRGRKAVGKLGFRWMAGTPKRQPGLESAAAHLFNLPRRAHRLALIVYMYVSPCERRRGVGEALVDTLCHELVREHGGGLVMLTVDDNGSGRLYGYYERMGFRHARELSSEQACVMLKKVDAPRLPAVAGDEQGAGGEANPAVSVDC